jgi:hypothetical protein
MDFALTYLFYRLFYRIYDFFHHWYIDGSRTLGHEFMSTLSAVDRTIALKITIRYFFEPLYKDYSIVGRVLGVIFRSGRIIIGLIIYPIIAAIFVLVYLAWIAFPPVIIFYVLKSL